MNNVAPLSDFNYDAKKEKVINNEEKIVKTKAWMKQPMFWI